MKNTNKIVYTKIFEKWKKGGPPARPTPSELKFVFEPKIRYVANLIKKNEKRQTRVAILGATPELRDLGIKYGAEVWALDVNPNMIAATDRLMRYSKSKNNKSCICDWLKIPKRFNQYFDLVCAEQSYNIVPLKFWGKLSKQIRKILKPKSFVLLKFTCIPAELKDALAAVLKFKKGEMRAGDLSFILHFSKEVGAFNPQKGIVDLKKQPAYLDKFYQKGVIFKKQWQEHEDKIGAIHRGGIILNVLSKFKTTTHLQKYFKILKIMHGRDFLLCRDMNIYWGENK